MRRNTQTATTMGTHARDLLGNERSSWRVLATVTGAIYILGDSEELLWITNRPSARHRRVIEVAELPSLGPPAGAICWIDGKVLRIEESLAIDLQEVPVWAPHWPALRPRRPRVSPHRLEKILARLSGLMHPQESPAVLPPQRTWTMSFDTVEGQTAATVRDAVETLRQMSTGGPLSKTLRQCAGIIGLGGGLTPSGDDLLGAYLVSLRTSERLSGRNARFDWPRVFEWLGEVSPRTNQISATLLSDCANGDAALPLHDFVMAALCGASTRVIEACATNLARIGHSSGWDMITGVHTAISAIERMTQETRKTGRVNRHAACRKEVVRVR